MAARWALKRYANPDMDSGDLQTEVWLKLRKYSSVSKGLACKTAINVLRDKQRRKRLDVLPLSVKSDPADPFDCEAVTLEAEAISAAIAALKGSHQDVLMLAMHDLTGEEAAGVLGITHAAYRVRLARARAELRKILG